MVLPKKRILEPVKPLKAYRSTDFLNSGHARHIRILCEYEETMQRLRAQQVRATVMFFGSARSKDADTHAALLADAKAELAAAAAGSEAAAAAAAAVAKLEASAWMCPVMESVRQLAAAVTRWSVQHAKDQMRIVTGVSRNSKVKRTPSQGGGMSGTGSKASLAGMGSHSSLADAAADSDVEMDPLPMYLPHSTDDVPSGVKPAVQPVFVCTGGGPGFMEAANQGASDVKHGKSIGMGITLPFEAGLNPYVTPELAFEFHYFFTRKFWMAFHMQALVVAPGGFGTLDELFELLTLKQTGKIQKGLPIVLFGRGYWLDIINWHSLVKYGVISQDDVDNLLFTDDVDEALKFITDGLQHVTDSGLVGEYGE